MPETSAWKQAKRRLRDTKLGSISLAISESARLPSSQARSKIVSSTPAVND